MLLGYYSLLSQRFLFERTISAECDKNRLLVPFILNWEYLFSQKTSLEIINVMHLKSSIYRLSLGLTDLQWLSHIWDGKVIHYVPVSMYFQI